MAASRKGLRRVEGIQDDPLTVSLRGHEHAVLSLAVSPDGKALASGWVYGSVLVWNVADRKLKDVLSGDELLSLQDRQVHHGQDHMQSHCDKQLKIVCGH